MRRLGPFLLPALVVCHVLAAAPSGAADERATPRIYKWVDANGIAHYTTDPERIPKALRNRIETLERRASEPAAAAEPTTTAPAAAALPATTAPAAAALPATTAPAPAPVVAPAPATVVAPAPATAVAPAPALVEAPELPPAPQPAPGPAGGAAPATVGATLPATIGASVPAPAAGLAAAPAGESWATRDAAPRLRSRAELLASGQASPEELAALDTERQALDARIAEVEAEIVRDETTLKDLISDRDLDAEVPLFDRPEFLEISRRLPELQARLQELRDERAKLETP